jgi:hypothetical protein
MTLEHEAIGGGGDRAFWQLVFNFSGEAASSNHLKGFIRSLKHQHMVQLEVMSRIGLPKKDAGTAQQRHQTSVKNTYHHLSTAMAGHLHNASIHSAPNPASEPTADHLSA